MWEYDIELIKIKNDVDGIGVHKQKETVTTVMANKKEVPRNEFYSAQQSGLKNICIFIIHPYEYNDEQYIRYNGDRLKIFSTYKINDELLEIKCAELASDFNGN